MYDVEEAKGIAWRIVDKLGGCDEARRAAVDKLFDAVAEAATAAGLIVTRPGGKSLIEIGYANHDRSIGVGGDGTDEGWVLYRKSRKKGVDGDTFYPIKLAFDGETSMFIGTREDRFRKSEPGRPFRKQSAVASIMEAVEREMFYTPL